MLQGQGGARSSTRGLGGLGMRRPFLPPPRSCAGRAAVCVVSGREHGAAAPPGAPALLLRLQVWVPALCGGGAGPGRHQGIGACCNLFYALNQSSLLYEIVWSCVCIFTSYCTDCVVIKPLPPTSSPPYAGNVKMYPACHINCNFINHFPSTKHHPHTEHPALVSVQ